MIDSWDLSWRGTTKAEGAQGTTAQSHASPRRLVHGDKRPHFHRQDATVGILQGHRLHEAEGQADTALAIQVVPHLLLCFIFVTGPNRSMSLKLSDARVYEPQNTEAPAIPNPRTPCPHLSTRNPKPETRDFLDKALAIREVAHKP